MPTVDIKGVGKAQFPDSMSKDEIREFLRKKYSQPSTVQENVSNALTPKPNIAAPYEPSLLEKIGQGVSDALYDNGIVSDRYGAQRIGGNIAGIGEMLPVIGDAAAGDEFGRAVAGGDTLGAGIALLGMMPFAGDVGKKLAKASAKADNSLKDEFMGLELFHGTNSDIKEFDLSRGGATSKSPVGKLGISVALDEDLAKEYAELASVATGSPTVIKLVHRAKNPTSITLDGSETNMEIAATVEEAWENGIDAIMIKNYTSPKGLKGQRFILVKDPSQLRKPGAKFDPKERLNPALLASLGGLAVYSGVSTTPDADELN